MKIFKEFAINIIIAFILACMREKWKMVFTICIAVAIIFLFVLYVEIIEPLESQIISTCNGDQICAKKLRKRWRDEYARKNIHTEF